MRGEFEGGTNTTHIVDIRFGDVVGEMPVAFDCEVRIFVAGGRPQGPRTVDCSEGSMVFYQWDSGVVALTVEVTSNAPIRVDFFQVQTIHSAPECDLY